ncbi:MAG: Hint domain-containing protein [Rhodobacteraceae bacterium]|nr:Hint domain-containing protein [Paracoccaceae bacterium]
MFMHRQAAFADARKIISSRDTNSAILPPAGLTAGMRVETPQGWRPVETLVAGDRVQTLDGGMRQVIGSTHTTLARHDLVRAAATGEMPLYVPGGALDTCAGFHILPDQPVLLDTHHAEAVFGSPLVLVPGAALEGWQTRRSGRPRTAARAGSLPGSTLMPRGFWWT